MKFATLLAATLALGACAPFQPYSDKVAPHEYIVQPGDNIELVAFALESTPRDLQRANPWIDPGNLTPGMRLSAPRAEPRKGRAGAMAERGAGAGTGAAAQPGVAGMVWPLRKFRVSSRYGRRWGRLHEGIDLRAPRGTPIRAAADGRVIFSGFREAYGHKVIISHGRGIETVYAHNSGNLVKRGQRVRQGDIIARVGRSGNATGYHLHFEIRRHGQPLDPARQIHAAL